MAILIHLVYTIMWKKLVRMGKYDPALLADYTREEWDEMDGFIDHWRDMTFSYAQ